MNANIQSQEDRQTSRNGENETDGNDARDMTVGIRDGQIVDPAHFGMLKSIINYPSKEQPKEFSFRIEGAELSDGVC